MQASINEASSPASPWTWPDAGMRAARFLFWAVVFGLAYTQAPLYYSNQNQYFLHGLAQGGHGFLAADWLANTLDPTPVFSALVACTYRFLLEGFFHVWYLLLLGLYFHSLVRLHDRVTRGGESARWCFLVLLVAVHAGLIRWAAGQLWRVDYPWYAQAGVANQYLLGFGLQPSTFGVLLVASLAAFADGRPLRAAAWAAAGAVAHSTYLLGAAGLVLAYMVVLFREGRARTAFLTGAMAFLLVLPVVVHLLITFGPTSPSKFAEAQELLVHFRIPHHAVPAQWFDKIAAAQVGWMAVGILLTWGTRLFPTLLIPALLALVLTLAQLATGSDTLALLFSWRLSAVLVPVATAMILTRLTDLLAAPLAVRPVRMACCVVLAVLVAGGIRNQWLGLGFRVNQDELPLLEYVRDHKRQGDVYLLPVEVPNLRAGPKGAASLNFTPPPKRGEGHKVISVDLMRFRLFTGAPIYVDFKSIPYKDVEVLEWRKRLAWVEQVYGQEGWDRAEILEELERRGITHVVMTADRELRGGALAKVHDDQSYKLYRVRARASERASETSNP